MAASETAALMTAILDWRSGCPGDDTSDGLVDDAESCISVQTPTNVVYTFPVSSAWINPTGTSAGTWFIQKYLLTQTTVALDGAASRIPATFYEEAIATYGPLVNYANDDDVWTVFATFNGPTTPGSAQTATGTASQTLTVESGSYASSSIFTTVLTTSVTTQSGSTQLSADSATNAAVSPTLGASKSSGTALPDIAAIVLGIVLLLLTVGAGALGYFLRQRLRQIFVPGVHNDDGDTERNSAKANGRDLSDTTSASPIQEGGLVELASAPSQPRELPPIRPTSTDLMPVQPSLDVAHLTPSSSQEILVQGSKGPGASTERPLRGPKTSFVRRSDKSTSNAALAHVALAGKAGAHESYRPDVREANVKPGVSSSGQHDASVDDVEIVQRPQQRRLSL